MRAAALALLLGLAPAGARAAAPAADKPAPPDPVTPAFVAAQMEPLRDALADPGASPARLSGEAASFFRGLQRETPSVHAPMREMARETVAGTPGTIDAILAEGRRRYDHYRLTTGAVPPADLAASASYARDLRAQGREGFDRKGELTPAEMGVFTYAKGSLEGGVVSINRLMAGVAALIGRAFAFSTLVHEATHALARAQGRLSPRAVVDGEVEAYRVEYEWLTVMDPSRERTATMYYSLRARSWAHPDDPVTKAALSYLEHLIRLRDTGGKTRELKAFVRDLGYEDGRDGKDGGVKAGATGATGPRA